MAGEFDATRVAGTGAGLGAAARSSAEPVAESRAGAGPEVRVDVIFAEQQRAVSRQYRLRDPSTVADALAAAASDSRFAGVDVCAAAAGIFGRRVPTSERLRDGDRVELYRPLPVDPKTARRARALRTRRGAQ